MRGKEGYGKILHKIPKESSGLFISITMPTVSANLTGLWGILADDNKYGQINKK